MNDLAGRRLYLLIAGVLVAVSAPLLLVVFALNDNAPEPTQAGAPTREVGGSLLSMATDTASTTLAKSVPPPPPPPPPAPPPVAPLAPVPPANPSGPEVLALEQRLAGLGYLVGKVDGVWDGATKHGVTAFQKVENLSRTGIADAATTTRLQSATKPTPAFSTPPDHFEVDIPRQVVFMVRGGQVAAISPTSTGNNKNFTSEGYTRRAVTPNGRFQINYKRNGWRVAPLGRLYRPAYFNGGIALHGSNSVPTSPASHGCVRLPMQFADYLLDNAPVGMVVYVYGGPTGPNPQPILDEPPLPAPPPPAPVPIPVPVPVPVEPPPALEPPPGLLDGIINS